MQPPGVSLHTGSSAAASAADGPNDVGGGSTPGSAVARAEAGVVTVAPCGAAVRGSDRSTPDIAPVAIGTTIPTDATSPPASPSLSHPRKEERRVGKECVSSRRSRRYLCHLKKKKNHTK